MIHKHHEPLLEALILGTT